LTVARAALNPCGTRTRRCTLGEKHQKIAPTAGIVARWLAVLFVIGLEVAQQQSSSGLVAVVLMLPFGLAMVLLSARIWQAAALPAGDDLVPALVGVA
jgi:protein-S-isoprenylcysteine O-methyltransferase Ste14